MILITIKLEDQATNFRVVPALATETETDILVSTHHPTHSEMRSLNNNQLQAFCLLHAENIGGCGMVWALG